MNSIPWIVGKDGWLHRLINGLMRTEYHITPTAMIRSFVRVDQTGIQRDKLIVDQYIDCHQHQHQHQHHITADD